MISLSDEGFSVKCDVSSYKPDELKLRLDGDVLLIEGEHKEENEQGSVHLRLQRSIRIPLPDGQTLLRSGFGSNGRTSSRDAQSSQLPDEQTLLRPET
ncbi:unnamed protein product, partial [Mesorhabditis belari]|uniref:SHSP domain-containing protein n=1 Tax=Mesorhabditis belari TaxID=2138241 RepID=A0AAF3FAM1_9BILA